MTAVVLAAAGLVVGLLTGHWLGRRTASTAEHVDPAPSPPAEQIGEVLRTAVDQLDLGVVVSDEVGSFVYRNPAASRLVGTHLGLIVDDYVRRLIVRAVSGEACREELELRGPPKTTLSLSAEKMANGAVLTTIEDVSERVRTEAVRRDFVANISHELKTPVGAIAVLADALTDESDVEVVRRVAERMADESHRAVRAIDDLLELSWIEVAVRTDETVDLTSVVRAATARGDVVDGGRGVTVTCSDPVDGVRLRADGRQLVSALGNLVENAVKYSDDGGEVQVRTRVDENAVEVMVVDQGIGIPTCDLDRVFERFYRVDKARSRATGGTGLGLSIVRHVATNHGGEVLVSSREGEGSSFVLRLPASLLVDAETEGVAAAPGEPRLVRRDAGHA